MHLNVVTKMCSCRLTSSSNICNQLTEKQIQNGSNPLIHCFSMREQRPPQEMQGVLQGDGMDALCCHGRDRLIYLSEGGKTPIAH